jgi:hypothetical protein
MDDPDRPGIPPALLTTLLHQFMSDEMRISKGADKAVGKYMETFVREAVARAAFERAGEKELGGGFMEASLFFPALCCEIMLTTVLRFRWKT